MKVESSGRQQVIFPNPLLTAPGTRLTIEGFVWECVHETKHPWPQIHPDTHAFWERQS